MTIPDIPEAPEGIRVHARKGGKFSYEARVKRKPLKPLTNTFKTLDEAVRWKATVEALIDSGVDPSSVIPKKAPQAALVSTLVAKQGLVPELTGDLLASANVLTVRKGIENYLKFRAQSHNKLPSNQITDYNRVADDWEDFLISDLRNEDMANYVSTLLRTPLKRYAKKIEKGEKVENPKCYAEATVRKFIYAMKVAIEWQAKNGKVKLNEFVFDFEKNVIPPAWAGHRERRLVAGEEEKLCAAGIVRGDITYTPDDWRALIGFTLETAMRQQELAKAEWKHFVEANRILHIPARNTKTEKARNVLLSSRALEILAAQKKSCPDGCTRIFHQFSSAGSICDSFAKLTKRAEIEQLTFHDLRHEATSRLCESKNPLPMMALMEMTGHRSMATFGGYVHLISNTTKLQLP